MENVDGKARACVCSVLALNRVTSVSIQMCLAGGCKGWDKPERKLHHSFCIPHLARQPCKTGVCQDPGMGRVDLLSVL